MRTDIYNYAGFSGNKKTGVVLKFNDLCDQSVIAGFGETSEIF